MNQAPRIRIQGVFVQRSKTRANGTFRGYSATTMLDGKEVHVSFATPNVDLLDASDRPVCSPNTYTFPGHVIEAALDAEGKPIVQKDGTACYDLVETDEAETPIQTGKRFAGRPPIDMTKRLAEEAAADGAEQA